jgi:4-diphosphocytidyl-2-C-methyl-D-erythritol kinase
MERCVADRLLLPSYAKVNYTLDVLSRRSDGYHNIATVMQTVSIADSVVLARRPSPGIEITCDAPGVPSDGSNLAYRAAEAALALARRSDGVSIAITKRIPTEAGLGGGSSNAAAVLRGINALLGLGLSHDAMMRAGMELGSDVPFFVTGGTAAVRGRGESVTALADGPPLWFVVVKPPEGVSTAWAYAALDALPGRGSARATRSMEAALDQGHPDGVIARMTNDFERVVCEDNMRIALLQDELIMARARAARLCGSGSAVFGVTQGEADASEVARVMRLKYGDAYVCRAIPRAEALRIESAEDGTDD